MKLLAQLTNPVLPPVLGGGSSPDISGGTRAIGELIVRLLDLIFIFAFIFALFGVILGGVQWVTSSGDKANLENARNKIVHSLLGLIIVASTWAIMNIVAQFFGLNLKSLPIPQISP